MAGARQFLTRIWLQEVPDRQLCIEVRNMHLGDDLGQGGRSRGLLEHGALEHEKGGARLRLK